MKKRILANVEWRKYISVKNKVLNQYLDTYGDEILLNMLELLHLALISKRKSKSIVLIEFKNSDIISVIQREDYAIALHQLLTLCEKLEKYEICAKIVSAQKQISSIKVPVPRTTRNRVKLTN